MSMSMSIEDPAVTNFREYLRIKSVQPQPDYESCVQWIHRQSVEIGLGFKRVELQPPPAEFVIILKWSGRDPSLKSVMLNSHMDVVPVDESKWTYDPFAAVKDEHGNIYGRGTQDMKSVGVQYLEAIRRLKSKGFVPLRNIYVTFVTDEELGSAKGMAVFIKTPEFKEMNVGVEFDESGANPGEEIQIFNAERSLWQVKFAITGNTGHALMFVENSVGEKLQKILNRLLSIREAEQNRWLSTKGFYLGDVCTVNMTMLEGGVQPNVLPSKISVVFDLRITPHWTQEQGERLLDDVCKEAGPGVTYNFIHKSDVLPPTPLDSSNMWWITLKSAMDKMGVKVITQICPGATDARYIRSQGIAAFGLSPMNFTPVLLHDNNEFLNEKTFLRGIEIFEGIIENVANIPTD